MGCAVVGADVLLSVRDTGIGISPDDRDRIFTEFVQLNNPQRSRDRGVGLGLAIVRHITTLLNHEVQVESEPGKGTTITVRLPAVDVVLRQRTPQCAPQTVGQHPTPGAALLLRQDALPPQTSGRHAPVLASPERLKGNDAWSGSALLDYPRPAKRAHGTISTPRA